MRSSIVRLAMVATALGCGGRIDAAAKADLERRVAALVPSGQAFPAPATLAPKPLAVGQWTLHKLTHESGEHSLVTYKLVGFEAGAFWLEVAHETYYGKTVAKLLVAAGDRSNPSTFEIRAAKVKDRDGKVTEVAGAALARARAGWQPIVSMLAVAWQGLPQESVGSIAGSFAACFKANIDGTWGGWQGAATVWMHPLVPLSSLVMGVALGRPGDMELVGFGDEGARSEIP